MEKKWRYWKIEVKLDDCVWCDVSFPAFVEHHEYRVKPKQKVKKWRYWLETEAHYTEEEAQALGFGPKIDGTMMEMKE